MTNTIIEVDNITVEFNDNVILNNLSLSIEQGQVFGIVGGSGAGKTTLLRSILMLQAFKKGSIKIFGKSISHSSFDSLLSIQKRCGVVFQQNALFRSLTVLDNVAFPLREYTNMKDKSIKALAMLKIALSGLSENVAIQLPAELSGGMEKRAAFARAIALDPEILFLDEPTAGLDPNSAAAIDELILNLQATMGLTIVMITHDIDSLWKTTNQVAFLGEKKVLDVAPMKKLVTNPHPDIQSFFSGPRGRTAEGIYDGN